MPNTFNDSYYLKPASRLLNVGCGQRYDRRWVNLDLSSRDASVVQCDINHGLPFADGSFDAVYHSHVFEHLKPEQGQRLLKECFRVLAPGGVLRIVVPDLEKIAQLYLQKHQSAWSGDESAAIDYRWMKMELLDQLVREKSGGRMGPYMASSAIQNSEFVRQRVGDEFYRCRVSMDIDNVRQPSWMVRFRDVTRSFRQQLARRCVRWLLGKDKVEAFEEGLFRDQGEIHRWMYDRYSLRQLCQQFGFEGFDVCSAFESRIEDYVDYQLDADQNSIRKPDSLFVECVKPRVAVGSLGSAKNIGATGKSQAKPDPNSVPNLTPVKVA